MRNSSMKPTKSADLQRLTNLSMTLIAYLLLVSQVGCQTSPTGRKQFVTVPEEEVEKSGVAAFQDLKIKQPVDQDPSSNSYLKCISNAIISVLEGKNKETTWEVVVFRNDEVNAFALPGGKIGVYSGLLKVATTQEQVATVLAHEVGHVIAQHGRERISQNLAAQGALTLTAAMLQSKNTPHYQLIMASLGLGTQVGVLLPFSRTQESEADQIGLELMAKAGFNPSQAIALWENMAKIGGAQPPVWLSGHPPHGARINNLHAHMVEATVQFNAAKARPECKR